MRHPQRLTFICTSAPWHPGPRARIIPLAAYAAAHGITVTVLCLTPFGQRVQADHAGVTVIQVAQMHVGADGTPYTGLRLCWTALSATIALTIATLRSRPEAIVIAKAQPMNGIAGLIAAALRRVPVFLDSDDDEAGSHAHAPHAIVAFLAWFAQRLPGWVESTICATQWQATQMTQHGHRHVAHIPNGITAWQVAVPTQADLQAFQLRYQLPPTYLVYIGNVSTFAHAVDLLLLAYARSKRRIPLVLAGSGNQKNHLVAMAHSLGIAGSLIWMGEITPEEVPFLLAGAAASVDPVHDIDAAAARCPLKIIESIAQGIPVITSTVGDRNLLLGAAGIYATAGDPDAYAQAINGVHRRALPPKAIEGRADRFRWEVIAPQWYAAQQIFVTELSHA